jgi:microcystin-dependent protein
MPFWGWSKTAGSNASSDPTINWAEGMAPSAVNDSARAMAARLAEWRDDISGTITTGGTGTAYTVASNQVFDTLAHMNGAMIAFVPHTTNGATVTLNVDGLGAKPLRYGPSLELQSGVLIQGTPYVATYNNSDAAFYLQNFSANPYGIPLGGLLPYIGTSAPNSAFVFPFGQAISRTTYSTLFSLIGTGFGTGDGSTTFNVIDLRGRAIFGVDNMGGSAAGRISVAGGNFDGTLRGGTGGAENYTLSASQIAAHTHTASIIDPGHTHSMATTASQGGTGVSPLFNGPGIAATGSATTGISVTIANNTGGGGSHPIMPPAMTLPYILRVV